MMSAESINPCEGMSKSEVQAFERIAFGASPRCSEGTIRKLLDAGLIERHEVILAVDRLGPVLKYEYSVPIPIHFQWYEYKSKPKAKSRRAKPSPMASVGDLPLFKS